jgi:hypothetical protein
VAITSFANTQGFVYGPFVGTVDQTLTGMTNNTIDAVGESIAMIGNVHFLASTYTLNANTNYAIAVRPTTATNISASLATIGSADVRTLMMCGATWQRGTRTNQSGAFGSLSTTTMFFAMPRISGIDTGSAGGGLLTHPGLTGGIRG